MDFADGILFGPADTHPYCAAARGLLPDETPFKPHLGLTIGVAHPFDIFDGNLGEAINCLIANLLLASWQPQVNWVFYSRDNNHYAAMRALAPAWYSRRIVLAAIGRLSAAGLIEEQRTRPSPGARLRSRVRASPSLAAACKASSLHDLVWVEPPPVILRQRHTRKCLDPYAALTAEELAQFDLIAQDVGAHNGFLSRFAVGLLGASTSSTGKLINPRQRSYYRVFNGNLRLGGRWYGPWWQSLSGRGRQHLTIDGQPTIELDFSACQLRLLLARCGHPDPLAGQIRHSDAGLDPYRVEGIERQSVKSALLFMINADDPRRALRALSHKLRQSGDREASRRARHIMRRVEASFPSLRNLWFTGIGLELQCVDAAVCTAIQRHMRDLDLPVLSIHDSFITFRHAEAVLQHTMRDCFNAAYAATAAGSTIPFVP